MKSTPFLSRLYILEGHKPVRCEDVTRWAEWFATATRVVCHEQVGNTQISTVFLGLDYQLVGENPPRLFETMVSGGTLDGMVYRHLTWQEAEKAHAQTVGEVEVAQGPFVEEGPPAGVPVH
jgi:hypothetical protein